MPSILEESTVDLERLDLSRRVRIHRSKSGSVEQPPRTAGVHISGILRYVAVTSGLMKVVQEIDEEMLSLRMVLGLAWEEFCVSLYPEIEWQPGEISADGVLMTCDGHSALDIAGMERCFCLEEFKLTWKKAKTADELLREQWYWIQQGKGYCSGYDARFVRWHICYVNGDYRGSGPVYKRYLIQFSERDVESTHRMLAKYKDRAVAEAGTRA